MPASRAYSSSSGGAAWPGANQGQPRGLTPRVRVWFQGDLSEKNCYESQWSNIIFKWRKNASSPILLLYSQNLMKKAKFNKKFHFPRCPFELPANHCGRFSPLGLDRLCWLAGNSKGHRGKWEFLLILAFYNNFWCHKSQIVEDAFFHHVCLKSHNVGREKTKKAKHFLNLMVLGWQSLP